MCRESYTLVCGHWTEIHRGKQEEAAKFTQSVYVYDHVSVTVSVQRTRLDIDDLHMSTGVSVCESLAF